MKRIYLLSLFLGFQFLFAQQAKVDSLQKLIAVAKSDTIKVQLMKQVQHLLQTFDVPNSLLHAQEFLDFVSTAGFEDQIITGYQYLGYSHSIAQQFDSARLYYQKVDSFAQISPDPVDKAISGRVWGSFYALLGEFDSAVFFNEKSVAIYQELGNQEQASVDQHGIAAIYIETGDYDLAIERLTEVIQYYQQEDNFGKLSSALSDMGRIHFYLGEIERALEYYQEAYQIAQKGELQKDMANAINNMASIYLQTAAYDKAKQAYRKAITLFLKIDDTESAAIVLGSLGAVYIYQNDPDSMSQCFEAAISQLKALGRRQHLAIIHHDYGFGLVQLQAYKAAQEQLDVAWNIAEVDSNFRIMESVAENRALLYQQWGKPDAAFDEMQRAYSIREKRFRSDMLQKVADAETKYQTQKTEAALIKSQLVIAEERNKNLIMLAVGSLVLIVIGISFWMLNTQRKSREREAKLAFQLKESEAATLRELDQLKSRFFANISHEFRTPLTLILGPLQHLLDGTLSGKPETSYHLMHRNAKRLLELINQLLDLSKLESGKLELQPIRADILPFLRALAGNFESLASDKQIRFHNTFPSQPIVMTFDRDKLEKTVSNLLSNAFKYTEEEGDVWFEVERLANRLELRITDTGIGMTEEQVEHIFERFYQGDTSAYASSGLGLALVKELVELFEGEISVNSQLGEGSRFVVSLPIVADESLPIEAAFPQKSGLPQIDHLTTATALPILNQPIRGEKLQLLVVEDNQDVRAYLRNCLQNHYHLIEAENGQIGLELARKHMPDLIISDVMMPQMDGNALSAAIKSDPHTAHIPLILLTAKAGRESKIEGLQTGADDYLAKPFDEQELKIRVQNLIEQRRRLRKQFGKDIVRLSPEEVLVESADQVFLKRVISVVEQYMSDETFTIQDLGREVGMSRVHLHRKLKALTDQSPSVFLRTLRLKRGQQLLQEGAGNVAEIAFLVGFSSQAYFSKCFKDQFGVSPSEV